MLNRSDHPISRSMGWGAQLFLCRISILIRSITFPLCLAMICMSYYQRRGRLACIYASNHHLQLHVLYVLPSSTKLKRLTHASFKYCYEVILNCIKQSLTLKLYNRHILQGDRTVAISPWAHYFKFCFFGFILCKQLLPINSSFLPVRIADT